jgi:hypothetical protein
LKLAASELKPRSSTWIESCEWARNPSKPNRTMTQALAASYGLLRLCYVCPETVMTQNVKDFEGFDPKTAVSTNVQGS